MTRLRDKVRDRVAKARGRIGSVAGLRKGKLTSPLRCKGTGNLPLVICTYFVTTARSDVISQGETHGFPRQRECHSCKVERRVALRGGPRGNCSDGVLRRPYSPQDEVIAKFFDAKR